MQAKSTFTLDAFQQADPYSQEEGVNFARAQISKTFVGDFEGTGAVEMLSARGTEGGAGYVALERIEGTLKGKRGSFALLHIGTMSTDSRWAKWPIVPGSGTGELAGISGEGEIDIDAEGRHHFTLSYEL